MSNNEALNYSSYLKLDEILNAQHPKSEDHPGGAEHDEMLFIIIHQVFELWFKQLLHEIDYACEQLNENNLGRTLHVLKRIRNIVKVMVSQVDVIETMTPIDFNAFRSRLESASGLQSYQFREVEFALGFKRPSVLSRYNKSSEAYKKLSKRLDAETLWHAFLKFIAQKGYALLEEVDIQQSSEDHSSPDIIEALEKIYHSDHSLTQLCESLIDLDEGLQEWRYRHVKMVQRTIGMKQGSGGTEGANYLMASLNKPLFPALWEVRMKL